MPSSAVAESGLSKKVDPATTTMPFAVSADAIEDVADTAVAGDLADAGVARELADTAAAPAAGSALAAPDLPGGWTSTVPLAIGAGVSEDLAGANWRAGDLAIGLVRIGRRWSSGLINWAAGRAIAPNSVTAISLLLALCAAAWLSGGTPADYLRALLALAGWSVTRVGARQLRAATPQRSSRPGRPKARQRPAGQRSAAGQQHTDWLVLPGYDWRSAEPAAAAIISPAAHQPEEAGARTGLQVGERNFDWLFAVATMGAQCAVYGGIAAGGLAAGWTGTWPLAIVTVIMVSVAEVAQACSQAAAGPVLPGPDHQRFRVRRALAVVLPPPLTVKVCLAALAMVWYGPRVALCTAFALEAISLGRSLTRAAKNRPARPAVAKDAAITVLAATSASQDVILACRDDGPFARWTGRGVQGNLMPLPSVLAGLVAVVLLTVLGMRSLPGVIALAPVIVLLLAAPGSSHPHDGRFDWLAPVLLNLSQFCYLAALGLARSVPGPAVFATCSMVAVWYAGLVVRRPAATVTSRAKVLASRKDRIRQILMRRTDGIGWELRVCVVAASGIFGIATFGYLGLAAYLAALMSRKVVIGYLIPAEDHPQ